MLRDWLLRRRLRALATHRQQLGANAFSSQDYAPAPQEFAGSVVAIVAGLLPLKYFPVLPQDALWQLFDLDQGTLESEVEDFLERVAPGAPALATSSHGQAPETVHDLVSLVYRHAKPFLHNVA